MDNYNLKYDELNDFSIQVYAFFKDIKKNSISIEKKRKLYLLIMDLETITKRQKMRFLLYYNLMPNNNGDKLTFSDVSKIYNCSGSAIRNSIIRVRHTIARLEDRKKKNELLEIMEDWRENG